MQEEALPKLGELKEPPQFSNYKWSWKYKQALRDAGIDINRLNKEGGSVIVGAGFPLIGKGVEQNADLNNLNIQDSPRV